MGSPYVYMWVENFGRFLFGGCDIDHQTAKFSGYTALIIVSYSNLQNSQEIVESINLLA